MLFVFVYIMISTLISFTYEINIFTANVIKRIIKLGLFVFTIELLIPRYLDKHILYKTISIVSIAASIILLIQYVAYYSLGFYWEAKIPFLIYANEAIESFDYQVFQATTFRPSSIFLEPAHFSVYIVLYIGLKLFELNNRKQDIYYAILASLCLVLSTSSTGLILVVFLWSFYFFYSGKRFQEHSPGIVFKITLFSLLIGLGLIYINTPQLYYSYARISDFNNVAVLGRIKGGEALLQNLTGFSRLIGVGFGNLSEYVYFNSVNYFLYCTGYIGLFLLFLLLLFGFMLSNILGKVIVILFVALCFSSPIAITINIILYGAIIYLNLNKKIVL